MQAFQHSFGAQELLAPAAFRRALQEAFTDCTLDCWFSPRDTRIETVDGMPVKAPGAWVIWMLCTEYEEISLGRGFKVFAPFEVWAPVFRLDGTFGLPTTPGKWVIDALKQCDMTREENRDRHEKINRLHAEDQMSQYREQLTMREEITRDKLWKKMLAKQDERMGKETMSGDDRAAWRRHIDKVEKDELARAEQRARDVQFYRRR